MLTRPTKRPAAFEPWTVDVVSGHCASGTQIHACFDPTPTSSGAIKAVGPFVTGRENLGDVSDQIKLATLAIENALPGYVVWGESYDSPDHEELRISILGGTYGFYPNIALRSSLFFAQPYDVSVLQREWFGVDGCLRHRSNGLTTQTSNGPIDLEVLHPDSCKNLLSVLCAAASAFFGVSDLEVSEEIGGWTVIDRKRAAS